jgi:two-component system response regulator HydG
MRNPDPTTPQPLPEGKVRVLVIDDDPAFLASVSKILTLAGCEVIPTADPVEGLVAAGEPDVDVVLSDIQMPNLSGMALLREVRSRRPGVEVILMTGGTSVGDAVAAMKEGAYDYLTKPFDSNDRVSLVVGKAAAKKRLWERARALQDMLDVKDGFEDLLGQSQKMKDVFRLIDGVAYSSATVLVQGESGTGKELVARAVHRRSPRKDRPFVAVNCSALSETLLESELFGYAKGAFTGAAADRRGLFEAAEGGSIFLDEIGDVPPATQVRLLRVLQEGEIRRVGEQEARRIDVRVIAATNVDLERAAAQGRFRQDLFFRINVVCIQLPPLRDRPEDLPPLAQHFVRKYAKRVGKQLEGVSTEALEALTNHSWPGNVRELENAIERAVVLARGNEVVLGDLPPGIGAGRRNADVDPASLSHLPLAEAKRLAVGAFERRYLANVLRRAQGNVTRAARAAGVDRSNFRKLLREYGVAARVEPGDDAGSGSGP